MRPRLRRTGKSLIEMLVVMAGLSVVLENGRVKDVKF